LPKLDLTINDWFIARFMAPEQKRRRKHWNTAGLCNQQPAVTKSTPEEQEQPPEQEVTFLDSLRVDWARDELEDEDEEPEGSWDEETFNDGEFAEALIALVDKEDARHGDWLPKKVRKEIRAKKGQSTCATH
jgi:hypothetical protein